jgi:hypothetical protein
MKSNLIIQTAYLNDTIQIIITKMLLYEETLLYQFSQSLHLSRISTPIL